eukprot:scaffold115_cov304-Prasinococcus_capsulatus_cf.AAC.30
MAAAEDRGTKVVIGNVLGLRVEDSGDGAVVTGVHVEGVEDAIQSDSVVISMGPWSVMAEEWLPGVKVPLEGVKSTSLVYPGTRGVADDPFALFCGEDDNGCHLEVYPRPSGEVYICGCGGSDYVSASRLRPGGDCDNASKIDADPSRVDAAARSFSNLAPSVAFAESGDEIEPMSQACMRPCAPDALPILGKAPGYKGAFLACGHNCWGILWAPITGKLMAEEIIDGRSMCVDISRFSAERFMPKKRGGRGRHMRTEGVGEQW